MGRRARPLLTPRRRLPCKRLSDLSGGSASFILALIFFLRLGARGVVAFLPPFLDFLPII